MTNRKLILDSDGGVDDAQALILLVANGRAPDVITTVFGNVGRDQATTNLLAVASMLGVSIPTYKGADRPLTQPIIDAKYVHGDDGLGGAPRPTTQGEVQAEDAISALARILSEAAADGDKVDILMIGPFTNLALALRVKPAIVEGIGTLTIMGGNVYGRGNTTPAAEFNVYADPEAAHIVFTAGIETTIVPWEACTAHFMEGARVDSMFDGVAPGPMRSFSKALADHARGTRLKHGMPDRFLYVDPLAAAVVVDPSIVTKSIRASSSVALAPASRGA